MLDEKSLSSRLRGNPPAGSDVTVVRVWTEREESVSLLRLSPESSLLCCRRGRRDAALERKHKRR